VTEKEKKIFKYGIIVGELGAFSKFNDKTNHGYEFSLELITDFESIPKYLENLIEGEYGISETYKLNKIDNKDAFVFFFKLLHDKWYYAYQNKDENHLSDLNNSFSLYMNPWKKEWVEEFVDFLLQTLNPINIFEINYVGLKYYYASDFDEFIFECEDEIYHFRLKVSD